MHTMMTRGGRARQEETKLQQALSELKSSKQLCEELIRERDENEIEMLKVLDSNKKLKLEMSELHSQYLDAVDTRNKLQIVVESFSECSLEYEKALNHINSLKRQLEQAHHQISMLESNQLNMTATANQSLFDELVGSAPDLVSASVNPMSLVTIDLTNDSVIRTSTKNGSNCSKNKLKKYVNINRYIKKTQHLVKKHKFFIKNVKLNRERLQLIDKLDMYASKLEQSTLKYKKNTSELECEIYRLQDKLNNMHIKYERSENQLKEYILAMNELVKYNSTQTNSLNTCLSLDTSLQTCAPQSEKLSVDVPSTNNSKPTEKFTSSLMNKTILRNKIVIFSDEIGKDMGHLISNTYKGHSVINFCTPGRSYHSIMQDILHYSFCENTILVILIGDRGSLTKHELMKYSESLHCLRVKQTVLFTFPYSNSLPQVENNIRYKLNLTLHTLICQNNNNYNNMHLIDINNYLKQFYLTKDSYYLSHNFKRQIATSLSYYFDISAKNLATRVASIEQRNTNNIDLLNSANYLATNVDLNHLN